MNKPKTYDDFLEKYARVPNHIGLNASWDGCMFETFPPEVDYVCEVANNKDTEKKVWTLMEGGGSTLWLVAGYHLINRIGYFITQEDWVDSGEVYEIWGEEDEDELRESDPEFTKVDGEWVHKDDLEIGGEG